MIKEEWEEYITSYWIERLQQENCEIILDLKRDYVSNFRRYP